MKKRKEKKRKENNLKERERENISAKARVLIIEPTKHAHHAWPEAYW